LPYKSCPTHCYERHSIIRYLQPLSLHSHLSSYKCYHINFAPLTAMMVTALSDTFNYRLYNNTSPPA
ncbi:hypothetical protein J6590_065787, partial [Homalodisca vitripennis]